MGRSQQHGEWKGREAHSNGRSKEQTDRTTSKNVNGFHKGHDCAICRHGSSEASKMCRLEPPHAHHHLFAVFVECSRVQSRHWWEVISDV